MDQQSYRPNETLPTGTVTFLFTDIEGSTELAQRFPNQMPELLERHHAILRQAIQDCQGTIFRSAGDAFYAAFHSALDALHAALDAQRSLQHESWDAAPILVRMGIHTGTAQLIESDNQTDYRGYLTLALTQRVMASGHGGQVLLSGASAELLRGQLPEEVTLLDMGEHQLKGVVNSEHLWQAIAGDLRKEFPPLKTLSVRPNNLPIELNRFIGRERELAQTDELLASTHLLTLIGPGGTGKTRLSLQLAMEVLPEFSDGTWLVELAPLANPALVGQTIAATLGLREIPGLPAIDLLINALQSKMLLVILDNCEHLVEGCAQIAETLLRHCPGLKIIASSREALGIPGEIVFRVPPLALPDLEDKGWESVGHSESVQLFVERAKSVRPGFQITEKNAPAIAQICLRLDGIPLALELAAARIGMLTPEQIAARLDDRFQLLTGGSRTALPRQQTLRSLIDWSYDLLSEEERGLFCQLSVFVGGWTLEASEAICPDLDVLDLLTQLVKKSLVVAEEREDQAETRFRLLETIRQYARDQLLESGEAATARSRHLSYYLRFAEAGEPQINGPKRLEWVDRFELEHDNFRAALQWGLDHDVEAALRLGGVLAMFWGARGFILEGQRWLKAALARAETAPPPSGEALRNWQAARAKALNGVSQITYGSGDYRSGLAASQEAAQIYRELKDWQNLGFTLGYIGNLAAFQNEPALAEQALSEAIQIGREHENQLILCFALGVLSKYVILPRGDLEAARTYAEESSRFSREIGLDWAVAQAELILARIASLTQQWNEARMHIRAAADVYRELRDPLLVNTTYHELADLELRAGNLAEARQHLQNCILTWQKIGQMAFISHELESFAYLERAQNRPVRAACLLGAAEAILERLGTSTVGVERIEDEYQQTVDWLHTQLDEKAYDASWSEGCGMTMDQAIVYATETHFN